MPPAPTEFIEEFNSQVKWGFITGLERITLAPNQTLKARLIFDTYANVGDPRRWRMALGVRAEGDPEPGLLHHFFILGNLQKDFVETTLGNAVERLFNVQLPQAQRQPNSQPDLSHVTHSLVASATEAMSQLRDSINPKLVDIEDRVSILTRKVEALTNELEEQFDKTMDKLIDAAPNGQVDSSIPLVPA